MFVLCSSSYIQHENMDLICSLLIVFVCLFSSDTNTTTVTCVYSYISTHIRRCDLFLYYKIYTSLDQYQRENTTSTANKMCFSCMYSGVLVQYRCWFVLN